MKYFTEDFLAFFKELAANNNKEWFDSQRKRYETSVKKPFENFIGDLILKLQELEPEIDITARDAIFRINRDIRFSQDKSPYKLNRAALISPVGRKDKSVPGYYISIGPEEVNLGGGAYFLDKDQLRSVRRYICQHSAKLDHILHEKQFTQHFSSLQGEENKRLDKEFQQAADSQALLYKKQFYFMTKFAAEAALSETFLEQVVESLSSGAPVNNYFKSALKQ